MTLGTIVTRRNFSLVARSLLFVVKSLVTRCKIRSLLVAKFARYSFQKLLFAKNHSLLVARCRSGVTLCNFMKKKLHHSAFL